MRRGSARTSRLKLPLQVYSRHPPLPVRNTVCAYSVCRPTAAGRLPRCDAARQGPQQGCARPSIEQIGKFRARRSSRPEAGGGEDGGQHGLQHLLFPDNRRETGRISWAGHRLQVSEGHVTAYWLRRCCSLCLNDCCHDVNVWAALMTAVLCRKSTSGCRTSLVLSRSSSSSSSTTIQ